MCRKLGVPRSTHVYPSNQDEDLSDFYSFTEELESNDKTEVIKLGVYNSFNWESIMGFRISSFSFSFRSVEDFKTYAIICILTVI